jgi:Uma2 family endonuclease
MPQDVLLAVEISHATVHFDSKIKAPLYAEAGIAEYWQLDVRKNILIVRSNPVSGEYRDVQVFRRGQAVSCKHCLPFLSPLMKFSVMEHRNLDHSDEGVAKRLL